MGLQLQKWQEGIPVYVKGGKGNAELLVSRAPHLSSVSGGVRAMVPAWRLSNGETRAQTDLTLAPSCEACGVAVGLREPSVIAYAATPYQSERKNLPDPDMIWHKRCWLHERKDPPASEKVAPAPAGPATSEGPVVSPSAPVVAPKQSPSPVPSPEQIKKGDFGGIVP